MKLLILIRGLPGSGKSTIAKKLALKENHLEADMFHMCGDCYVFDRDNLGKAHDWCRLETERKMRDGKTPIAISNTFTKNSELKEFLELAKQYEYNYQIITIENVPFDSRHGVPKEVIEKMKNRFEMFEPMIE